MVGDAGIDVAGRRADVVAATARVFAAAAYGAGACRSFRYRPAAARAADQAAGRGRRTRGGFNRLLATLGRRNEDLQETAHLLEEAQSAAGIGSYSLDIASERWRSSAVLDQIFDIDDAFDRSTATWMAMVHAGDRAAMASTMRWSRSAALRPRLSHCP